MARMLVMMVALATVIATARYVGAPRSYTQREANLSAYCTKSRALIGQAYFATHVKTCRTARRLLA